MKMGGLHFYFSLLAFLLLWACKTHKTVVKPQIISQEYVETSGFERVENLLIKNKKDWNQTFQKIYKSHSPLPVLPEVDFEQNNIVVFAFGEKSTGGYFYEVESYQQEGETLEFKIKSPETDPFSPVTMAITYPLVYCIIPASNATNINYDIKK